MAAPVDGVGDPALEPGARVAELERVRVREVPQINRVRIRHVVELRMEVGALYLLPSAFYTLV